MFDAINTGGGTPMAREVIGPRRESIFNGRVVKLTSKYFYLYL